MSAVNGKLQMIATPDGAWCDPETGLCHLGPVDGADTLSDTADEAPTTTER